MNDLILNIWTLSYIKYNCKVFHNLRQLKSTCNITVLFESLPVLIPKSLRTTLWTFLSINYLLLSFRVKEINFSSLIEEFLILVLNRIYNISSLIVLAYVWSLLTNFQFLIRITHPCPLTQLLLPNDINWDK
jgi:hypothetical protein